MVEDSDTTVEDLRARIRRSDRRTSSPPSPTTSRSSPTASARTSTAPASPRVDGDAFAIYGADKLTNLTTIHAAVRREGQAAVAEEFKVPLELKLEVWAADAAMLRREAPELPLLDPLDEAISLLRADLSPASPRPGT